jgi:hypothetical protein
MAEAGRLVPPYPVENCANSKCQCALDEEVGAYVFKIHDTGKICVFCGDCARYVELNAATQFSLIAL